MSANTFPGQSFPESRLRRLGHKLSLWRRRDTTAADVSSAFLAAAKAHDKYSSAANETHTMLREWSSQLGGPSFAPELGNPLLHDFMLDMCSAVKPDASRACQLGELFASVSNSFETLAVDETSRKKYAHELILARKNVDKCKSNNEDPGLYEKNCEHWESRLAESIRLFRTKSSKELRDDIGLLLSYLQACEPAAHSSVNKMDSAYRAFAKQSMMSIPTSALSASPRSVLNTPYHYDRERERESSSPLYDLNYPSRSSHEDNNSVYSANNSLGTQGCGCGSDGNLWN